jgi:GNAT superfamily N-acetyltransferase
MSSKIKISVGSLQHWLVDHSADEACDGDWTFTPDQVQADRLVAFNSLCEQLSPTKRPLTMEDVMLLEDLLHERIICLWRGSKLLATAQASLVFPGLIPTVHISNVVVEATEQGKGYGSGVILLIFRLAKGRWWSDHRPLRFMLTSQEKRGTRGFYESLGFSATPTYRYVR